MDALATLSWPVLDRIDLGPLAISPHGIGIAVGYLLGAWWMMREGPKRGLREEHISTIILWALVGAIVGARFFYVLGHLDEFDSLTDMLAIWRGGISLVGGIFGAIGFAVPLMRRYGYRFGQVMDSAAVGLAFGIAVGRIGDLVIGDHLGKPTDFLIGWRYTSGTLPGPYQAAGPDTWIASLAGPHCQVIRPDGAELYEGTCDLTGAVLAQGPGVHQTALYDILIAGALFAFLFWLSRKPRREGVLIAAFGIWYGAGRLLTDFLRVDKTWPLGLTGSQWASVGVIAVAVAVLVRFALRPGPAAVTIPEAEDSSSALASGPTTSFTPPPEPRLRSPGD
ncbi:MAG TPA: prolipoprotein diacylglyceryl transferase family protein [Actinomycetota bacterium]